jgi:hypothetical protein
MDLAWNALDADLPTAVEAEGEKYNPEVTPVEFHSSFDIPANDWRKEIRLHWYQGGLMPNPVPLFGDLNRIDHGVMFKGTQGYIVASFSERLIIPFGKDGSMTYYKPRPKEQVIPSMGNFQTEWVKACKGNLKTTCNFDYGGKLIETMLLGHVAYRVFPEKLPDQWETVPPQKGQKGPTIYRGKKKLTYDGATGKVTNCDEANAFISRKYRDGWVLDG